MSILGAEGMGTPGATPYSSTVGANVANGGVAPLGTASTGAPGSFYAADGSLLSIVRILSLIAVPIGIAPTGSVAANGAVTLGTALPLTYSAGIYLYYPTGAIYSASPAGYYWTVMSSTTVGTVYENVYSPGTNIAAVPASPTAIVAAGPGAFTGDTTERAAIYVTVPGGLMGGKGTIEVSELGSYNNTVGTKTFAVYIGGTSVHSISGTTSVSLIVPLIPITNRGVTDRQVSSNALATGTSSAAPSVASIDTSADFVVEIRIRHSTATDAVVLEYSKMALMPQAA